MSKPCEYCGTDLPLGVDRGTRRVRSHHFATCPKRLVLPVTLRPDLDLSPGGITYRPPDPVPNGQADQLLATAHRGYVGINDSLEVASGFDHALLGADATPCDYDAEFPENRLSASERIKLADVMIERWTRYRDAAHRD